jgi:restriction endonuclease Mrr
MKKITDEMYSRIKNDVAIFLKNAEFTKKGLLDYIINEYSQTSTEEILNNVKAEFTLILKQLAIDNIIQPIETKSMKEIIKLTEFNNSLPENSTVISEIVPIVTEEVKIEKAAVLEYKLNSTIMLPLVTGSLNSHLQETPIIAKKELINKVLKDIGVTEGDISNKENKKYVTLASFVASIINQFHEKNLLIFEENNVRLVKKEEKKVKIVAKPILKEKKVETIKQHKNPEYDVKSFKDYKRKLDSVEARRSTQLDKFLSEKKTIILEALCNTDSTSFEVLCTHLICKMYGVEIEFGKAGGGVEDHGIDGEVNVQDPLGFPSKKIALQCKCYRDAKKGTPPSIIKQFYASMVAEGFRKGLFIVTGVFDEMAINKQFTNDQGQYVFLDNKKEKNFSKTAPNMIICIDGNTLVDYLLEYKIGFIYNKNNVIVDLDPKYFN